MEGVYFALIVFFACFCASLPLCRASDANVATDAVCIDLSTVCNRAFKDEGETKPGWTGQGGNDFRNMPLGLRTLCGVPFQIIDPATNSNRSCLVLSGAGKTYADSAVVSVGRKGGALVFLHTLAWSDEAPVAKYVVRYSDGQSQEIPISAGKEILSWWGLNQNEQVKIAVVARNLAARHVCVQAWQWINPRPDVEIKSIEFVSTHSKGVPIVVAATLLARPVELKSEYNPPTNQGAGFVLIEAEKFATYNLPPQIDPKTKVMSQDLWENKLFSGGAVLQIQPPKKGAAGLSDNEQPWSREGVLRLTYNFAADQAGDYALWARVGPVNVYSPFRWRVDQGPWGQVTRSDPYLDMFEIGFWATMGWVHMGQQNLSPGQHVLTIEVPRPAGSTSAAGAPSDESTAQAASIDLEDLPTRKGKNKNQKETKEEQPWTLMADCFVATRVPFHPCGTLKPGENFNTIPWLDSAARESITDLSTAPIAPPDQRDTFDLDGVWEMARDQEPMPSPVANDEEKLRGPLTEAPDVSALSWMGVNVPHVVERPETGLLWRRWYRKCVSLPADLHGKRISLLIDQANYTASVFVNGKLCGTHVGGFVPFSVDITDAIKPGEENQILIGVKGMAYYRKDYRPEIPWDFAVAFNRCMLAPGRTGWADNHPGLAGGVRLQTHGVVRGHDVFVQSRYEARELTSSVEVDNASSKLFTGKVRFNVLEVDTNRLVAQVGEAALSVGPNQSAMVEAVGSARDLTPWWPGSPKIYVIQAQILDSDDHVVDVFHGTFGFRQVQVRGTGIFINGRRFNFRSVLTGGKETLEESMVQWRAFNCNSLRLPNDGWTRYFSPEFGQHGVLSYMDQQGVCVRFCSQINGMVIDVANDDPRFWKYSTAYLKEFIKAYRNHPSIVVWVAENEVDLITNMSNSLASKKAEAQMIAAAAALDPSRPIMADGAGDLAGELPICNWHYPELGPITDPNNAAAKEHLHKGPESIYPDNAYSLSAVSGPDMIRPWDRKRPLWAGETYFYSGPISWQAWVGGSDALDGRAGADQASTRFETWLARGYRWAQAAGFDLFLHADRIPDDVVKNSLSPLAVFSRDCQKNQFASASFSRRLKVFNDTLDPSPVDFAWRLLVDGKAVDAGGSKLSIAEGCDQELTISVKTPAAKERIDAVLELTLSRSGIVAYTNRDPISIFPAVGTLNLPKGMDISLVDPGNTLQPFLEEWGAKVIPVDSIRRVPAKGPGSSLIIIGPGALDHSIGDLHEIVKRVQGGARVLVMEQEHDYPSDAFPFAVAQRDFEGAMCFPVGSHPAIRGLTKDDLCMWGPRQAVFRNPFVRSAQWPLIVDASSRAGLDVAPVVETSLGNGHLILSQMLISANLKSDPSAGRLLAGLIQSLADRPPIPAKLASLLPRQSLAGACVHNAAFVVSDLDANMVELALEQSDVVLVNGDAGTLGDLSRMADSDVKRFTARGGWIIISGLENDARPALNKLVGERLVFRPVGQERIVSARPFDPLMVGIDNDEFYREKNLTEVAAQNDFFLFGDRPLVDNVFTSAVVTNDITGLSNTPVLANGLTSDDHWHYIDYAGDTINLNWPSPTEINRVVVRENRHYRRMEELTLTIDGDTAHAMVLPVPMERSPIVFEFSPRKASSITLQATRYKTLKDGPFGWDKVEIDRVLPPSFTARVVPLTRPAGLVKFPMGKGGIVLNLTSMRDPKDDRILMQMLHNLGVARSREKTGGDLNKPRDDGAHPDDMMSP